MSNLSDYKYPEFNEVFEGMIPVSGSGGGGGLQVTFTSYDTYDELNVSYNDIIKALNDGTLVFFVYQQFASNKVICIISDFGTIPKTNEHCVTFTTLGSNSTTYEFVALSPEDKLRNLHTLQ